MNVELTEWKVDDYIGTPEDRAMFLDAAREESITENDPGILADAIAAVNGAARDCYLKD